MNVDLRQAEPSDVERLMAFYQAHKSAALPVPSTKTLGDAISEGRMLVVEADRQSPILAAAAIFGCSPQSSKTYVGELSGTRVTEVLNGYGPLSVQRILLAARLLGHVAFNNQVGPNASSTLIVVVKADNERSIRNVTAAGFIPVLDRPDWIIHDEHDWYGVPVGTEWIYFIATNQTARQAYADLYGLGVFTNTIRLSRVNRPTGKTESLNIRCHLGDLQMAQRDLADIHAGASAGLSPLPQKLLP